ncbi:MAG: response regulator [Verrucomicrobia bacterium]|nr:response regulator [Verrucomicrobiota bacterium]
MNNNPPAHILLVEDEPAVREVAEGLLTSFGYTTTAVSDGAKALGALEIKQPDLILSDVRMPVVDGFELLQDVRANPAWAQIPFVIVSAKAESADVRMGMSLGADDYVTKPYQPDDLAKAIAVRLLRSKRLNQAVEHQQRFLTHTLPHELRTPLTGVIGYADLMAETAAEGQTLSVEELADYSRALQHSGLRLFSIVENFLFWARLESKRETRRNTNGALSIEETITAAGLSDVVKAVAKQFHRPTDLALACPAEVRVRVATLGFEFVARHLVENAFKYSVPGTAVGVAVWADGDRVRLRVTDGGRGMTPEQIARIGLFRQFEREQFEQQGMGMGLVLAAGFARWSGGTLELRPGTEHQGLTATLSLPGRAIG